MTIYEPGVVFQVRFIVGYKGNARINGMRCDKPVHGVTAAVPNCRSQYAKTFSVRFRKWQHGDSANQQGQNGLRSSLWSRL